MNKEISIYINIPFCKSRCYYCDFFSNTSKDDLIENYIDAVCSEILQNAEILSQYKIKTVYFGGGTPSYIDSKYIAKVIDTIKLFSNDISEVTIEINPATVNIDKMKKYKEAGINRISIGLQSTHDDILKNIGRAHNFNDFLDTLKLSKSCGFNNISIDLIYPLPNLNLIRFKESINQVLDLKDDYNIKHISIYNLELHENTKLYFLINEGFLSLVDEEEEYKMKEYLETSLVENGFLRYEISNFAIPSFESKHNLNYWKQGEYLGVGAGASSFFGGSRYSNVKNIEKYIDAIFNDKNILEEKEDLDKLDLMKEYVILLLRLKDGIDILKFKTKFDVNIFDVFKTEIDKLVKQNLIVVNNKNILLTKRGSEVANIVWQEFI